MEHLINKTFTITEPEERLPYKTLITGEDIRRQVDKQPRKLTKTEQRWLIEKEKENQEKQTEFLKPFLHHPLSESMIKKFKNINPSLYGRMKPFYILDKDKNILAFVTKSEIRPWGIENGYKANQIVTVDKYRENPSEDKLMYLSIYDYDEFVDTVVYV